MKQVSLCIVKKLPVFISIMAHVKDSGEEIEVMLAKNFNKEVQGIVTNYNQLLTQEYC